MSKYYDEIAESYDELYAEEQKEKIVIAMKDITINPKTKLLDVGCGTGFYLDDFNCNVTGIEHSEKMLLLYKGKKKIIKADAEKIPFKKNTFDIVTSFTAIQNFKNVRKGIKEIKRVGTDLFILTFLKRGSRTEEIKNIILTEFSKLKIREIPHHKDIILIIKQ